MRENISKRVLEEASLMLEKDYTVRVIGNINKISKSTVHKDLRCRLKEIDYNLYLQVQEVLKRHLAIRHVHGGESTRKKYQNS